MKRILGLLASSALCIAPLVALADPWNVSEGYYYGANQPTAVQGSPYPFALDSSLNVKVNCTVGCSGGGGTSGSQYNPSATPLPTATVAPPAIDNYQETYIAPGPHASAFPITGASYARTGTVGTIAAGGTAQTWANAGAITHGCLIQNRSTEAEYLRLDGSAATTGTLYLAPNGYYECSVAGLPSTSVSILGATTGDAYYSEVW